MDRGARWIIALLALNAVLLAGIAGGLAVGGARALQALATASEREELVATRLQDASTHARSSLARVREQLHGMRNNPKGPLNKLERQLDITKVMAEEQLILIGELAA